MDISGFTPERISGLLKEVEAGATVSQVCRRYGIAPLLYYRWRLQHRCAEAEAPRARLHEVMAENESLKKLLAEVQLEIALCRHRLERMRTGLTR